MESSTNSASVHGNGSHRWMTRIYGLLARDISSLLLGFRAARLRGVAVFPHNIITVMNSIPNNACNNEAHMAGVYFFRHPLRLFYVLAHGLRCPVPDQLNFHRSPSRSILEPQKLRNNLDQSSYPSPLNTATQRQLDTCIDG